MDVATFERRVAEGTPEALAEAAALYTGDLLWGFSVSEPLFEEWLVRERERLRELALEALARLLAHQGRSGATEGAIQSAVRLLALDPLQEAVHRALMRLYVRLGRRASALHQYQVCVGILQRELGIEPEAETKELYQEILRRRPSRAAPPRRVRPADSGPLATLRRPPLSVAADAPLIGRDAELARLRALLAEVIGGQGRVAAIIGDAGVGKARLVTELVADVDLKSGVVLVGRCHESEQILRFGPWVDALRTSEVTWDRGWLDALPPTVRRELGRLLPGLESGEGEPTVSPDYLKLFEGVALFLGHAVGRQPAVLILEDIHWADEMSVRLLAFIGRRLTEWRLLVLVTARAEELVDAPVRQRTLGELEREPHVTTMALGPLSRSDTVGLVQALAGLKTEDATVARLGEQAAGGVTFEWNLPRAPARGRPAGGTALYGGRLSGFSRASRFARASVDTRNRPYKDT